MTNIGDLRRTGELSSKLAQEITALSKERAGIKVVLLPNQIIEQVNTLKTEQLRKSATIVWEKPENNTHMFGFGKTIELKGTTKSTLAEGITQIRETLGMVQGCSEALSELRCFGGARFDSRSTYIDELWEAYGTWSFVIPELLIINYQGELKALLIADTRIQNTLTKLEKKIRNILARLKEIESFTEYTSSLKIAQPIPENWNAIVQTALDEIEAGKYQKVVLAIKVKVQTEQAFNTANILKTLVNDYPNCYIFKLDLGSESDYTWLGASPELLVNFVDGIVHASSLASSAPRSKNLEKDINLGQELLTNQKELLEHDLVVQTTKETLEGLCTSVEVPQQPEILKMLNIQHLHTPITGIAKEKVDLLDFLQNLHPTPAVGGWPKEEAIDAIRRLENFDRGWYAGPIGWVNYNGEGEFAVALRSALVGKTEALLYAGAGIVKGSQPANELNETKLKLQPLLEALSVNKIFI